MAELNLAEQLARDWQALVARFAPQPTTAKEALLETGGVPIPPLLAPPAETFLRITWLPPVGPAGIFAELEEVRRAWTEPRLTGRAERFADRLVTSQWTLKDVLAHAGSWTTEFRQEAERVVRGEPFDYRIEFEPRVGPTAWNHARVAERREWPLAKVFEELELGTRELQDLALSLPAERLTAPAEFPAVLAEETPRPMWRSVAEGLLAKCYHDRHHLARIEQALAEPKETR